MKTVDYNIICEEDKNMQYIDLYWMEESDYAATNTKDGNAYGAYGFDRRHSLVQFMKYCIEYDAVEFDVFKPFAALGSGSPKLQNNEELATVWKKVATDTQNYPDFMDLQNQYAYDHYYLLAASNCLKAGLNIDEYGPILRGTLWLFITKFGINSGTKKVLAPFKQGIKDELEALHMIFSNNTSIDKSLYDRAIVTYNTLKQNKVSVAELGYEPGKETIEKIKAIDLDGDDGNFEESPIMPEETILSKTPGETKESLNSGELDQKFTDIVEEPKENKITKDHIDVKVVQPAPTEKEIKEHLMFDTAREKAKKSFDKKAEFKVCENWKHGYPVNLKYASNYYDEAKEKTVEIANNERKTMYVYGNKGQRLFMYDPKRTFPKTVNGYKVGTGIIGSTIQNEAGAFNMFDLAKRWADMSTQTSHQVHKVYLNQDCVYTSNVKVK